MATLKLTLDKRRKLRNGRSPLILRLTHKSNSTSIQTGIKFHFSEWDSKKLSILIKKLKGRSSRLLQQEFPVLGEKYLG